MRENDQMRSYCWSVFSHIRTECGEIHDTERKVSKYGIISGPYFPTFGLNKEKYEVSLCMQSKCGKMRTRNSCVFGHFSLSVAYWQVLQGNG